jgi:hypothetical protein
MPAAWAQRDDLLQVEGKVPHIAGTSRVVKIECRRQGWADGHDDRLPGWLPIWSATTSPLSQRRFRPRRRLRCRRKQGPIQFLENNPIQSSFRVRFMCPKTRRNWLRRPIVRFHPGPSCPQAAALRRSHTRGGYRHFRAIRALVGIRSTFAMPHLAESSEHPNTFTSFRRPHA